jgi:hypothetical protein
MQYLAPSICLLAGLGAARVLEWIRAVRFRGLGLRTGLLALAAVGIVPLVLDARHPYRSVHAQRARQFARRFWPALATGAVPVCLRWDLGLAPWDSQNLNVAVYLCNQRIYSPARQPGANTSQAAGAQGLPLRCVLAMADPGDARVTAWLTAMKTQYHLKTSRKRLENMAEPGAPPRIEPYLVYEFVPLASPVAIHRPKANRIQK